MLIVIIWFILVNIIAFFLFWMNDTRIQYGQGTWPLQSMIWIAYLGGVFGTWAGVTVFRHRHLYRKIAKRIPRMCIIYSVVFVILAWVGYDLEHPRCPNCGSRHVAIVMYGKNPMTDDFEQKLRDDEFVLGGIFITSDDARFECRECRTRFGRRYVN